MSNKPNGFNTGFTLIELLVVLAIIGILVGMLLPSVQMIREAARRTQCSNNVKQHVLALANFEESRREMPPGFTTPGMTMWSAFTLPFIEQDGIYQSIDLSGPWTSNLPDATEANISALGNFLEVFQCPSAGTVRSQIDSFNDTNRVPSCYLACASGLLDRESGERPWCGMDAFEGLPASDGVFFQNSQTTVADVLDGLSNTMIIGEAIPDQSLTQIDFAGNLQKIDHWYIGSSELETYQKLEGVESAECSECLGSTACPINAIKDPDSPADNKELCFSSQHLSGVNVGYMDGHVKFVAQSVDSDVWSSIGTRSGRERHSDLP